MIYNTCVVRIHSNKCHLQDNIYNTVIYCNNWGLKFHKKRNKAALPLITDNISRSKTERSLFLNCSSVGAENGSVHIAAKHPSGCISFPWIAPHPSGRCLCRQLWQEGMCLVLGVCVCVSISGMKGWKMSVSVCDRFVRCVCVCHVCVWFCLCASASLTGV